MIKSVVLAGIFMGALPFLLGLLYTRFVEKEQDNILMHMAAGYVIMFGVFEILTLPLIFMGQSLSLLTGIYGGIMGAACIASLVLNYKRIPGIICKTVFAVKSFTLCIWAQLLLIAGQILVYMRYQYTNSDDAFFVASATTSLATNTIFAYNPYTGAAYAKLPSRYVLSPFYAFTAVMSKLTEIHPAIVAHTVFMIVFLLLAYAVYALIGRALLSYNMEKVGYFMVVLSALNIFAAYSERTSSLFLLIRLWQGKAILAGILLPMVLYLAIRLFLSEKAPDEDCAHQPGRRADWLLLFLLMSACCMVSSMGIILGAIMLGIFGMLFAWRQKSFRLLIYSALCCVPNLLCAGIYLVIR